MNSWQAVLESGLSALIQLLSMPFYYLAVLLIILQYRRQISLERKMFHVRLHTLLTEVVRVILWGLAAGLAASIVMSFLGSNLSPYTVIWLWVVAIVLSFIRLRFLCFAYAAGLMGLLQVILSWVPIPSGWAASPWILSVTEMHLPSVLALVAVLHGIEALLIRLQGTRIATPVFVEGKRGKIVGGYDLQGYWPVPLLLMIPTGGQGFDIAWTPLFMMNASLEGWMFVGLPVLIGFSEMTTTRLPVAKTRESAMVLAYFSFAVLALSILTLFWTPFVLLAAIGSIAIHEAMLWFSRFQESRQSPLYVHDERGLMILAVIPKSPADEMGIQVGERIHKVNGIRIHTKEQLHQAMGVNAAFCRLEIINLEGHNKFLKRALFAGEHHELGIILAPDEKAMVYMERRQLNMMHMLVTKLFGLLKKQPVVPEDRSKFSG